MQITASPIPTAASHFENAFLAMRGAIEYHQAVVESEDSTGNWDMWARETLDDAVANLQDAHSELTSGIHALEQARPRQTTLIERLRTDLSTLQDVRAAVDAFDLDIHLRTELAGAMKDARAGQRLLQS